MRCSTNIYLTALAVADIVNLFCAFILSLQHYPSFKYGHLLYWSAFGLSNWFHDASRMYNISILLLYYLTEDQSILFIIIIILFSCMDLFCIDILVYISIYLTVSFTLERYISVCHPLRGQVLCTESRAKKVITGKTKYIIETLWKSFYHLKLHWYWKSINSKISPSFSPNYTCNSMEFSIASKILFSDDLTNGLFVAESVSNFRCDIHNPHLLCVRQCYPKMISISDYLKIFRWDDHLSSHLDDVCKIIISSHLDDKLINLSEIISTIWYKWEIKNE